MRIICKWLKISRDCGFYSGRDSLEADTWKDIFNVFLYKYLVAHSALSVRGHETGGLVTNCDNLFILSTDIY